MNKATFVSEIPSKIEGNEVPTVELVQKMIPQIPKYTVIGSSDNENYMVFDGEKQRLSFKPTTHVEIESMDVYLNGEELEGYIHTGFSLSSYKDSLKEAANHEIVKDLENFNGLLQQIFTLDENENLIVSFAFKNPNQPIDLEFKFSACVESGYNQKFTAHLSVIECNDSQEIPNLSLVHRIVEERVPKNFGPIRVFRYLPAYLTLCLAQVGQHFHGLLQVYNRGALIDIGVFSVSSVYGLLKQKGDITTPNRCPQIELMKITLKEVEYVALKISFTNDEYPGPPDSATEWEVLVSSCSNLNHVKFYDNVDSETSINFYNLDESTQT